MSGVPLHTLLKNGHKNTNQRRRKVRLLKNEDTKCVPYVPLACALHGNFNENSKLDLQALWPGNSEKVPRHWQLIQSRSIF